MPPTILYDVSQTSDRCAATSIDPAEVPAVMLEACMSYGEAAFRLRRDPDNRGCFYLEVYFDQVERGRPSCYLRVARAAA